MPYSGKWRVVCVTEELQIEEFNKNLGLEPYNWLIELDDGSSILWDEAVEYIDVYSNLDSFLPYETPIWPWYVEERDGVKVSRTDIERDLADVTSEEAQPLGGRWKIVKEQWLRIHRNGLVEIQSVAESADFDVERNHIVGLSLSKERTQLIFYVIAYFINHHREGIADLSSGQWKIDLVKTDESHRQISGSLPVVPQPILYGATVSQALRELIGYDNLLLFDGAPDVIETLDLKYISKSSEASCYTESLSISRKDMEVIYETKQEPLKPASIYFKEEDTGLISIKNRVLVHEILEEIDSLDFFTMPQPGKYMQVEGQERTYNLRVRSKSGKEFFCTGEFHRLGLPPEWPDFVSILEGIVGSKIKLGHIIDKKLYEYRPMPDRDVQFCMVRFPFAGQDYTYLCNDEIIQTGDTVSAPLGPDNTPTEGMVINVFKAHPKDAPYPYEKIKSIFCKIAAEDKEV